MHPADVQRELERGVVKPMYVVVGAERFLADRLVRSIREAALAGAVADFNEDAFIAGESAVDRVIAAARTAPVMAKRRFVLVRSVERWEPKGGGDEAPAPDRDRLGPLDRLAEYAENPIAETTLVLAGGKLDARRRLVTLAKKKDFFVPCDPLSDEEIASFVAKEIELRGCRAAPGVPRLVAQLAGPELGYVADAVERLTLFAGKGAVVDEDAVGEVVVRVREASVFALVDAVGRRDRGRALSVLAEVFDPRDRGLPLVGLLAASVRQLVKFEAARREGASPEDAARRAGAPPFKARELANQLRTLSAGDLERWLDLLADADLALKGSKRAPLAVLETLVLAMAS